MIISEVVGGEGASTPHFQVGTAVTSSTAFCVVPGVGPAMPTAVLEEIYRIALEWAMRSVRPSLYEQTVSVCEN